jgi:hypothetical protein
MRWSSMITRMNRFKQSQAKDKSESHFSDHISHFETQRKTRYQHIFAAIRFNIHCSKQTFIKKSSLICTHRNNDSFTKFHQIVQKKEIAASEKVYNRHVLKKSNSQKKRLFSFIIICFLKNINTIQSFREVRLRKRLILRDFYHTHQDFIAAYQKNFDPDSEYCSSDTVFTSVTSNQFSREFTFDSSSDTDLFDLKTRESSSNSFKQSSQSLLISISMSSSHHVRKRRQNDLFIRNNAIERFFWISNMTKKNEKSADFHEFLTLRRDRERRAIRVNWFSRSRFDLNRFYHFREASQD